MAARPLESRGMARMISMFQPTRLTKPRYSSLRRSVRGTWKGRRRHSMKPASTGRASHRQAARNSSGGRSPTPTFMTVQLMPQIRVTNIRERTWLAVSRMQTVSDVERVLVGIHGQFPLAPGATLDADRLGHLAAAGQNFRGPQIGEGRVVIADIAGEQGQPAGAAVTTAALVLHFMTGAFQAIQQGFALQQLKGFIRGVDGGHSWNPLRSSADTSESIWPTR